MASYVLVPGAGGAAWYWSRVVPRLEAAGSTAVAVDLPGDDPQAGLDDYVDRVVAKERLGVEVESVPGGHLCALSRPDELTAALLGEPTP